MAPSVQRFIFKHELGHCSRNYSYYKLFLTFCIATLATFAGILVTRKIMRRIASVFGWGGFLALLLGVLVAGSCDLILTFASNATWKLHEETMADHFAAHYSSYEDIVEAADFFAKHQAIFDESKNSWNWLEYLPSEIKTGHPSGESRSSYLLQLAAKKN
jgi:Zn-dependent protease with chaperone function